MSSIRRGAFDDGAEQLLLELRGAFLAFGSRARCVGDLRSMDFLTSWETPPASIPAVAEPCLVCDLKNRVPAA